MSDRRKKTWDYPKMAYAARKELIVQSLMNPYRPAAMTLLMPAGMRAGVPPRLNPARRMF
jgi:hypothetical protein